MIKQIKFQKLIVICLLGMSSVSISQSIEYREHELYSELLNEKRLIRVGLPKNYDENKTYPFVYLLDGELIFEYATGAVSYLKDFEESIPDCIVIGIPNISRGKDLGLPRKDDDTPTHLNFISFIEKEVFPMIENNYGTQKFKILYGWSLGSQFSASVFSTREDLFEGYIISGLLLSEYLYETHLNTLPKSIPNPTYLHASVEGIEGVEISEIYPETLEYFEKYKTLFSEVSHLPNLRLKIGVEKNNSHQDEFTQSFKKGMRFIFSDFFDITNNPDKATAVAPAEIIDSYDKVLETRYNNSFLIPESIFTNEARALYFKKRNKASIEGAASIIEKGLIVHSNSTQLNHQLSMYMILKKDIEGAKEKHKSVLKDESNVINKQLYKVEFERLLLRVNNPEK
tara:strand:- start:1500 stop:2696 length:1197 start_codon:yes stop_codon:yes gene_type:complete